MSLVLSYKNLQELIHGAPINKPAGTRCHVTMNFVNDDDTETSFTRTIVGSSSEYRIDTKVGCFVYGYMCEGTGMVLDKNRFLEDG